MINENSKPDALFDSYSHDYDTALHQGISVSGENKDYFARGRIAWLRKCLRQLGYPARKILDFGCGTGSATPFFQEYFQPEQFVGIDVSEKSIEIASRKYGSNKIHFYLIDELNEQNTFDMVFCNGVFHHIPLAKRQEAVRKIFQLLKPGGYLAFWENNPWNPGTRYIMSRIPFDRDAITLSKSNAKELLSKSGFDIISTNFLFIFPHVFRIFRKFEILFRRLPIGAQYQILCRKPL